jgi:hypothetical protein
MWLIDRQTGAIAEEIRQDLGGWLSRQLLSNIPAHRKLCENQLQSAGLDPDILRVEWARHLEQQRATRICKLDS